MSKEKVDHTFRRKWDKAELAAQAAALEAAGGSVTDVGERVDTRRHTVREADITGRVEARQGALDLDARVGQREEIADARLAGFYCAACDRSEKDSAAWLDHLNSAQHQRRSGRLALAEESTLNDVQARLRSLKRKALLGTDDEVDDRTLLKRAGRAGGKAEPVADEVDAFEARLEALRQTEEERKAAKKARKKEKQKEAKREAKRAARIRNGQAPDAADDDDEWEDAGFVAMPTVKAEPSEWAEPIKPFAAIKAEPKEEPKEELEEADDGMTAEERAMAEMMGFAGFSSTKNIKK